MAYNLTVEKIELKTNVVYSVLNGRGNPKLDRHYFLSSLGEILPFHLSYVVFLKQLLLSYYVQSCRLSIRIF